MGIVNVTPDSFFDGGQHSTVNAAVRHGCMLRDEGADVLDIGGASSRPGATMISVEEECRRIIPVIEKLTGEFDGIISVDTTWSEVARAALDAGASWINDISAGRFDPKMAHLVADRKCPVVLMHSRGTPQTMQQGPHYDNVAYEVRDELMESVQQFMDAGVRRDQIILDPGIGFAKTAQHSVTLLHKLETIIDVGFPVLIGTSRKSFIGHITGKTVDRRLNGSLGSIAAAYNKGATIFRVHDVDATRDFLRVVTTLKTGTIQ